MEVEQGEAGGTSAFDAASSIPLRVVARVPLASGLESSLRSGASCDISHPQTSLPLSFLTFFRLGSGANLSSGLQSGSERRSKQSSLNAKGGDQREEPVSKVLEGNSRCLGQGVDNNDR